MRSWQTLQHHLSSPLSQAQLHSWLLCPGWALQGQQENVFLLQHESFWAAGNTCSFMEDLPVLCLGHQCSPSDISHSFCSLLSPCSVFALFLHTLSWGSASTTVGLSRALWWARRLDPAGTSCAQLGAAPASPHRSPLLQPLVACTQHSCVWQCAHRSVLRCLSS